ncbi:MAG: hypothetical protein KC615_14525 [Anaerolineae bacterium]|nr:hypothetical protein [Anaerolineae bacterium]
MIRRSSNHNAHFLFDWLRTMLLTQWGGIVAVVALFLLLYQPLRGDELILSFVGVLTFTFILGQNQQHFLANRSREPFDNWTLASIIGGLVSVWPVTLFFGEVNSILRYLGWQEMLSGLQSIVPHTMLFLFTLIGIVQYFRLRQYYDHAWLWILANIVGGMMYLTFINVSDVPQLIVMLTLSMLAQHIVTGVALLYLFQQDSEPEDGLRDYAHAYVELYTQDERPYE